MVSFRSVHQGYTRHGIQTDTDFEHTHIPMSPSYRDCVMGSGGVSACSNLFIDHASSSLSYYTIPIFTGLLMYLSPCRFDGGHCKIVGRATIMPLITEIDPIFVERIQVDQAFHPLP